MRDMDEIFRAHGRTVYLFLYHRCGEESLAEDLAQETFLRALTSINKYDGSCRLSVWLCQIAKHLWYQELEKRKKRSGGPIPEDYPASDNAEDTVLGGMERLRWYRRIHGLPEPMREVLLLRAEGGLSFREIGEVMEKSENWARVTCFRARERLMREEQER